jgi:hypothetical protein
MSREQAEIKARVYTLMTATKGYGINYRAEEIGKNKFAVIQYLRDEPVGIAMS